MKAMNIWQEAILSKNIGFCNNTDSSDYSFEIVFFLWMPGKIRYLQCLSVISMIPY
ncbi:MAG: hypothetical protein ACLRTD_26755 [Bacteroides sp.]